MEKRIGKKRSNLLPTNPLSYGLREVLFELQLIGCKNVFVYFSTLMAMRLEPKISYKLFKLLTTRSLLVASGL